MSPLVTTPTKDDSLSIFCNLYSSGFSLAIMEITYFTLIQEFIYDFSVRHAHVMHMSCTCHVMHMSVEAHENLVDLVISLNLSHATISGITVIIIYSKMKTLLGSE